jgi:hypothetical protein
LIWGSAPLTAPTLTDEVTVGTILGSALPEMFARNRAIRHPDNQVKEDPR